MNPKMYGVMYGVMTLLLLLLAAATTVTAQQTWLNYAQPIIYDPTSAAISAYDVTKGTVTFTGSGISFNDLNMSDGIVPAVRLVRPSGGGVILSINLQNSAVDVYNGSSVLASYNSSVDVIIENSGIVVSSKSVAEKYYNSDIIIYPTAAQQASADIVYWGEKDNLIPASADYTGSFAQMIEGCFESGTISLTYTGGDWDIFVFYSSNEYYEQANTEMNWIWLYQHADRKNVEISSPNIVHVDRGNMKIIIYPFRSGGTWSISLPARCSSNGANSTDANWGGFHLSGKSKTYLLLGIGVLFLLFLFLMMPKGRRRGLAMLIGVFVLMLIMGAIGVGVLAWLHPEYLFAAAVGLGAIAFVTLALIILEGKKSEK